MGTVEGNGGHWLVPISMPVVGIAAKGESNQTGEAVSSHQPLLPPHTHTSSPKSTLSDF